MDVADKRPRVLLLVTGNVASGKTTLARELGARLGAECLSGDEVHDRLLGRFATLSERWNAFSPEFEERLYRELLGEAERAFSRSRAVVVDACFPTQRLRLAARTCARRHGAALLLVECAIDTQTQRRRLDARDPKGHPGAWRRLASACAKRFEPIQGFSDDEWLTVHGKATTASLMEQLLARPCLARYRESRYRESNAVSNNLSDVRAVTFDCWNTLLYEADWERAYALRVAELAAAARDSGLEVPQAQARKAFDHAWGQHIEAWHEGTATGSREVASTALSQLGLVTPDEAIVESLVQQFEEKSHSAGVLALDGASDTLRALGARGVACALICDTGLTPGRVIRRHLDRLGLSAYLKHAVFSDEVRVPKPDPRAFRTAVTALDVPAEASVHVGDLRRTDVAGGRSIGMQTVRITTRFDDTSSMPEADFVVANHTELRQLLTAR